MSESNPAAASPIEVDCRSVKAALDRGEELILVDCREPDEHALVNIQAARLLPMSQLQARCAELEACRTQRIVVHCHHGGRSLKVANWLRSQGFTRAQSMAGGIDQWAVEIEPGLPRY